MERGETSKEFLFRYVDLISLLGRQMNSIAWWSTWTASKNRYASPVLKDMEAIASGQKIKTPNTALFTLKLLASFWGSIRRSLVLLRQSVLAQIYLRKNFRRSTAQVRLKPVYVIHTMGFRKSFAPHEFNDPFFGPLRNHLSQKKNFFVLTIVQPQDHFREAAQAMQGYEGIFPFQFFLRPWDFFVIWLKIFSALGKSPAKLDFYGHDVSKYFQQRYKEDLLGDNAWLAFALHAAFRRIMKRFTPTHVLQPYENNPWERLCILAVREKSPRTKILGYQHTVVSQVDVSIFAGIGEGGHAPHPDTILTVGEVSSRQIKVYNRSEALNVQPSCALRYGYLSKLEPLASSPQHVLLVVLEGASHSAAMLDFVLRQMKSHPRWKLLIRPHPACPISSILPLLKENLSELRNVELSDKPDVIEDLKRSSAVFYWGSAVALEALMLGVPVIHFDDGGLLSNDPAAACTSLKWAISKDGSMMEILSEIQSLPENLKSELQSNARSFVQSYFWATTPERMDLFI